MLKVFSVILLLLCGAGAVYFSSSASLADEDCTWVSWECLEISEWLDTSGNISNDTKPYAPAKIYREKKEEMYNKQQEAELEYKQKLEYNKLLREQGKIIVEQYESQRKEINN